MSVPLTYKKVKVDNYHFSDNFKKEHSGIMHQQDEGKASLWQMQGLQGISVKRRLWSGMQEGIIGFIQ